MHGDADTIRHGLSSIGSLGTAAWRKPGTVPVPMEICKCCRASVTCPVVGRLFMGGEVEPSQQATSEPAGPARVHASFVKRSCFARCVGHTTLLLEIRVSFAKGVAAYSIHLSRKVEGEKEHFIFVFFDYKRSSCMDHIT